MTKEEKHFEKICYHKYADAKSLRGMQYASELIIRDIKKWKDSHPKYNEFADILIEAYSHG